jgi:exopolysaccharide biosynthesis glucuronosyltransferase PssD
MEKSNQIRILAICSAGGHWVQLRRLQPAWKDCHVIYVTTSESRRDEIDSECQAEAVLPSKFYTIVDATRWEKLKLLRQFLQIIAILLKERPHVIISTGAAPGFLL